jgi:hypothetical protein
MREDEIAAAGSVKSYFQKTPYKPPYRNSKIFLFDGCRGAKYARHTKPAIPINVHQGGGRHSSIGDR